MKTLSTSNVAGKEEKRGEERRGNHDTSRYEHATFSIWKRALGAIAQTGLAVAPTPSQGVLLVFLGFSSGLCLDPPVHGIFGGARAGKVVKRIMLRNR